MSMTTAWDFVEKYYPNYYGCEDIAKCNDLAKLLDEDFEDGDCAAQLLESDYNNDLKCGHIQVDYDKLHKEVYEKAIENFLKIQSKEISKIIFYDGYDEVRNIDTNEVLFSTILPEEIAEETGRQTIPNTIIDNIVNIWNSGGDIDQYLLNESLCSQEEREIVTDALNLVIV